MIIITATINLLTLSVVIFETGGHCVNRGVPLIVNNTKYAEEGVVGDCEWHTCKFTLFCSEECKKDICFECVEDSKCKLCESAGYDYNYCEVCGEGNVCENHKSSECHDCGYICEKHMVDCKDCKDCEETYCINHYNDHLHHWFHRMNARHAMYARRSSLEVQIEYKN